MNEKILKLLNDREEYYPHSVEKKYPHLLNQIFSLWTSPDFDNHINTLMLDKREHARQGFPPDVASELLRLSILHSKMFIKNNSASSWIDSTSIRID